MNTRRDFLILTSMAAAAAAAVGPKLFAAAPPATAKLAIGIAPLDGGTFADAASVPSSDGAFISRGARVAFAGAHNAKRSGELLAQFPWFHGSEKRLAPFRVWARGGNGVRFDMPVDVEQKLLFSLVAEGATLPVALSLQSDRSALKLVRGVYALVPLFDRDAAPRWPGYELRDDAGRITMQDRRTGQPAAFEHFLLRVDYVKTAS